MMWVWTKFQKGQWELECNYKEKVAKEEGKKIQRNMLSLWKGWTLEEEIRGAHCEPYDTNFWRDYFCHRECFYSVFDSGASQHIWNSLQGLTGSRTLRNEELIMRVGNGTKISAKAVGTYMLKLPSGEVLELKNCLYFPSCIKNLISISMLLRDGHSVLFDKMSCTLYFEQSYYLSW